MKKFILQIAFEKCYQELLLNTQEYVNKFGDYMSPNNSCIQSLCCEYEDDTLYAKFPQTKGEEFRNELMVLTLESILQMPLFIDLNKGKEIDNQERFISQDLYQEYITAERNVDPQMHFLFYVSLPDAEAISNIRKFVSHLPQNLSFYVDVVALPNELSNIYNRTEEFKEEDLALMANNLKEIIAIKNEIKKSTGQEKKVSFRNIYFLQNVDEAGHAKHFDEEKLTWVFGNLILSFIEGYDHISDNRLIDDITTFGIETFEIDKYKIINNWAFHIFRHLCDDIINKGDKDKTIDKDKVNKIFKEIFEEERKALEKIDALPDNEVNSYLDEWKEKLKDKIIEKIVGADLNNAERQLLLSYFENITDRDLLELEDFDISNFDLFDDLYIPYIDQSIGSDNPYNRIKEIILQIQKLKEDMKKRQKRIDDTRKTIDQNYRKDGKWTDDGYQIGDDVFRIHHKDWLDHDDSEDGELITDYEVDLSKTLPSNADLKSYFPPIKNQGHQGACASFSLTSVFEYFMQNETHKDDDMSEAFVYYNAREIKGDTTIDEGANLFDVVKGMADKGVCLEELCPYNPEVYDQEPSSEAYRDGQDHKVTSAKRVPVSVEAVKSAINEGYPVVGCFRVFESLQNNTCGFIPMPSDEERKEEESFHAMVICGYNNEHGHFIVRNSWGTNFGDNGYCYLPYSYLRDSDLTRYAVAITGIDAKAFVNHKPVDDDFKLSDKDKNIQYAILLNLLKEDEHKLEEERKRLKDLVEELKKLVEDLKSKGDIYDLQDSTDKETDKMSKQITEIQNQRNEVSVKDFKMLHIIHAFIELISCLGLGYGIYENNKYIWIPSAIVAIVGFVSWIYFALKAKKNKISELNSQIEQLENKQNELGDTFDEKKKFRDKLIKILEVIGDINDSSHLNRDLLNAIIIALNECYNQITDYLNNMPDDEVDNEEWIHRDWFKEIYPNFDDFNLLQRLLLESKDGDYKTALRKIQEDILRKLNNLFDKEIDQLYADGKSPEWINFSDRVFNRRVYAQIDNVKFNNGGPDRAKRKQCAYFLSDLEHKPEFVDCAKTDINSFSKNRYIFLQIKKVNIEELILFRNVAESLKK